MKYTVWNNDEFGVRKVAEFDDLEKAKDCVSYNRGRGFNTYARDENGETVYPTYKRNTTPFLSH